MESPRLRACEPLIADCFPRLTQFESSSTNLLMRRSQMVNLNRGSPLRSRPSGLFYHNTRLIRVIVSAAVLSADCRRVPHKNTVRTIRVQHHLMPANFDEWHRFAPTDFWAIGYCGGQLLSDPHHGLPRSLRARHGFSQRFSTLGECKPSNRTVNHSDFPFCHWYLGTRVCPGTGNLGC